MTILPLSDIFTIITVFLQVLKVPQSVIGTMATLIYRHSVQYVAAAMMETMMNMSVEKVAIT